MGFVDWFGWECNAKMSIFSAGSKGQKSEFLEAFLSKFEVPH
jgi:hypothetical protein